jgi:hypothetical protein
MDSVAVVVPKAWLTVSDTSVFVVSSLSPSKSSGSKHASSLGLLRIYLFTRLTNKPTRVGTNESATC